MGDRRPAGDDTRQPATTNEPRFLAGAVGQAGWGRAARWVRQQSPDATPAASVPPDNWSVHSKKRKHAGAPSMFLRYPHARRNFARGPNALSLSNSAAVPGTQINRVYFTASSIDQRLWKWSPTVSPKKNGRRFGTNFPAAASAGHTAHLPKDEFALFNGEPKRFPKLMQKL